MSITKAMFGSLIVGIEDDPIEPAVRIYIDARYLCRYILVTPSAGEDARRSWGTSGFVYTRIPDDVEIFVDDEEIQKVARASSDTNSKEVLQ
jgi:hypothetical protein